MGEHSFGLGIRCSTMVLLGTVWALMGVGVLTGTSQPADGLLFTAIPAPIRGAMWVATGLLSIASGITSYHTSRALSLLVLMPMLRLVSYLLGWVLHLIPGKQLWWLGSEADRGWYQGLPYLTMIAFVAFAAYIPPRLLRNVPAVGKEGR